MPQVQAGIELVGKRWSASILIASARGVLRYSDYYRMIDGISERLLATRLKERTTYNLIERGRRIEFRVSGAVLQSVKLRLKRQRRG